MNIRKVLIKSTWVLAGLLVLVLIGLTVFQNHLIQRSSREAGREAPAEHEMFDRSIPEEAAGDMGHPLDAAAEGPVMTREEMPDEQARQDELEKQRIEFQKRILEDPTIRESILTSLETQYAPLFKALTLSPEQQEKLKDLLADSVMSYLQLNPEILSTVTVEEKTVLQQRYDYLRQMTQFKVEALLGSDDYKKYQSYEDRTFSRNVVSGFDESLEPDNRLTGDQKTALIEIMYGEGERVSSEIGYDPTNLLAFPSDMDTVTVSKRMEITDRILFNSAESSRDVLSASQLEAYEKFLKSYSESVEMQLILQNTRQ